MDNNLIKLKQKFGEKIRFDFPFSKLTTLDIGGPISAFFEAKTEDELFKILKFAILNSIPYLVIGAGSNLLVSDSGFEGLVIKNSILGIEQIENILTTKAGTIFQDLVDFTVEKGLAGLNKMTGIPGTVGGAVYGNAGAYGQTISDHLVSVKCFNGDKIITLNKKDCGFSYRNSSFKRNKYTLLEIDFSLPLGNPEELKKEAEETLEKRLVKYPKGIKCPGSFFKNLVVTDLSKEILNKIPTEKIVYSKVPAGALLEEVGAKGKRLGNIEIAPYHANLFINLGQGKAVDFYNLAKEYAKKVKEKFGVTLEPEVQLINLTALN